MDKQKVVLANAGDCSRTEKLYTIIRETFPTAGCQLEENNPNMDLYLWKADTKYYTASIRISILKTKSIISEKFAASTEAVLLYFDSKSDEDGLAGLQSWLPFIDSWSPEIKLAVCDKCSGDETSTMSKPVVQKWCLDNGFELVELNPDPEEYDEYEDTGTKRIKGALLAHMWPEMELKDMQKKAKNTDSSRAKGKQLVENPREYIDQLLGKETEYDDVIGHENEQDNFERLFSKLAVMKEQASSMPHDQRKEHAENMVRAFWTALGGDDDEFAGLSSDDDSGNKASSS